jgi:hypothetical protein
MTSKSIETVIKMMESVPTPLQDYIIDEVRRIITEAQDEAKWQEIFSNSQNALIKAAKKAKIEIASGNAQPMDFERL